MARELAPVGDLVEGQPQAELAGLEPVGLLEGHHVGADEVHDVLVLDRLLGQQQVVLAEHPGGQPPEHEPHLGAGGCPAGGGQRTGQALGELVGAGSRVGSSLSRWGPTSRWKLATLACTHPARSVTRARAGPDADRSPVDAATSSSAWAVSSSKSRWRRSGR